MNTSALQRGGTRGKGAVAPRGPGARGLVMIGPAFAAAIAYTDPGNFATNFTAGARFGTALLWVVVLASSCGMFVQALSAKLGLATGRNLAELCRERFRAPTVLGLWIVAECVAMATDLAEVIGGAVAFAMLFQLPLATGGVLTAALSFLVLACDTRSKRAFESVLALALGLIAGGLALELARTHVAMGQLAGGLLPRPSGTAALTAAAGIIGATVMPHVVFLHSDLSSRHAAEPPALRSASPGGAGTRPGLAPRRQALFDVLAALGLAGLVNVMMLVLAAQLFRGSAADQAATLPGVHAGFAALLGGGAATIFAVSLLIAGLASSSAGTYAGQVVMAGFTGRRMPITIRRTLTALPALAVLCLGIDPTAALLWSQVVLCFGVPFVVIPLILLTRDRAVMGDLVNTRLGDAVAVTVAAVALVLDSVLLACALS